MFNDPYAAARIDKDESNELAHLANHHTSSEDVRNEAEDMLPAELEPVHRQLVTIGEQWRTRIPPADRLVSYTQNVGAVHMASDVTPPKLTATSPQTADTVGGRNAREIILPPHHTPRSRIRLLTAVAAAVAVVALLAGVFAMFAPGRFGGKDSATPTVIRATNTPVTTPRPTIGPVSGEWITSPQLSNLPDAPMVAPSDPRIIYQGGTQLKRSDDAGATWHVIPTPGFSGGAILDVVIREPAISTTDPNTLEISVNVGLSSPDPSLCPAGTQAPTIAQDLALTGSPLDFGGTTASTRPSRASFAPLQPQAPTNGFISCLAEYISRDGGAHWNKAHVPLDSNPPREGDALQQWPYLQGQGDRLYGVKRLPYKRAIYPIGLRIMTTSDAANWQLIDAPLLSQGIYICDTQATPTGSTIFALTNTFNAGCYTGGIGSSQIWRSDDAGAHWRLMGTFSTTAIVVRLLAVTPSDTGDWLLYAGASESVKDSLRTYVSSDGGATWQPAPNAGLPASSHVYTPVPGTLIDGSIVETFTDAPWSNPVWAPVMLTFYAWRAGDSAWRRVSPPITINENMQADTFLAIPGGLGRRNELWIAEDTIHGYAIHRFDV